MERDSIIFYRSYYEAIQGLPNDIQLEVYTAVMEYGLNGKPAENLKPIAHAMFSLIKPTIDKNNARLQNGRHGGRPKKNTTPPPTPGYSLNFDQEVERMKADTTWRNGICKDCAITYEVFSSQLQEFLKQCKKKRPDQPHTSLDDAKRHFRYWIDRKCSIAKSPKFSQDDPPADFDFSPLDYDN